MKPLAFIFILISSVSFAQITKNPTVKEKSTKDTYINRITITEDYTIVSMQHKVVSGEESAKEQLKKYLDNNPDQKEELSRMSPFMRNMLLQQWLNGGGFTSTATISIQPETYLRAKNGKKYKFIKATNIPVAPEVQEVQAGEDYFFRVYFEKLDPGVTEVDIIENDVAKDGLMTYWNFYGVEVNNPADGVLAQEEISPLVKNVPKKEILVKGRIMDLDSQKPLKAKVIVRMDSAGLGYDSLITSKTGYYEFILPKTATTFEVKAVGYDPTVQSIDLSRDAKDELVRNIYLESPFGRQMEVEDVLPEREDIVLDEELERVDESTIRLSHVLFILGKDEILMSSYRELDKLTELLKENPEMKIRIIGHTDNQGNESKNRVLSLDRAKAVKAYLVEKGIHEDRMTCDGVGSSQPAFPNDSEVNRQKNRRVEVKIL